MDEVFIIGAGMTRLGKHLDRSVKSLTAEAVRAALMDCGARLADIDAAWFCNTRQGVLEGQHGVRGQCALRALGLQGVPIFNTDNACASSSSGLYQALGALRGRMCEVALVVGAEKMNYPDKRAQMFEAFKGSWDRDLADAQLAALLQMGEATPVPAAAEQPTERSVFMDIYAAQARYHMARFGSTVEQFAIVAAKNHDHSQHNPYAQYRFSLTKEEVLADRIVSWPMTRSMCAPMSDGAAALIVVSKRALMRFPDTRPVRIRGMGLTVGTDRTTDAYDRHVTRLAAERAYEQAGLGPEDIHVAEVHDASAVAEIIQGEHLGFWAYGEGAPRTATGESKLGGKRPINVSGGLLSKGHPIGATGAIQIHDLLRQLRGEAGPSQVGGARIALAENGGGFYGLEEAVCAVTILEAGSGAAR